MAVYTGYIHQVTTTSDNQSLLIASLETGGKGGKSGGGTEFSRNLPVLAPIVDQLEVRASETESAKLTTAADGTTNSTNPTL